MKNILLFVCLTIGIAAVGQTYKSASKSGVSCLVPSNWTEEITDSSALFSYKEPEGSQKGTMAANMNVTTETASPFVSASDGWAFLKAEIEQIMSNVTFIRSGDASIGGVKAARYEYSAEMEGIKFHFDQALFYHSGKTVIVTVVCGGGDASIYAATVNKIFSSVKIN